MPIRSPTNAPEGVLAGAIQPRADDGLLMSVRVEPRKPRLAWQGMDRNEIAVPVPTQVVEIVRPARALEREGELQLPARAEIQDERAQPENRLIWTNDNIVALQTLLDERDPKTKDWRYRGKVDLVYIDPPFMVNADFTVDNTIDIELHEKAHVQTRREPSLVEILAYRDTWRQGLDSFLLMLRARLVLLKQLLAPTGSIFVHLDWHALHYVKVLMDELFGYENFQNHITWKRSSAHSDTSQGARYFGKVTDALLFYSAGTAGPWQTQYLPYDPSYIKSDYKRIDENGRRYRIDNLTAARPGGDTSYEFMGVRPYKGRYWAYSRGKMEEFRRQGRLIQTHPGAVPQYKRYLDEMPGVPMQDLWTDILLNNRSAEFLGYPAQKPIALIERIIRATAPRDGLVLDCFLGSGTTAEAAERLGCRWIGIDNGKYAVHLARKRLIQLHDQPRSPENPEYDYVECKHCKNIERKEKPQKSPGRYQVRPFTLENMGVYQRAEEWQGFQRHRSAYRDEMIKLFGGEPVDQSTLLHGRKGNSWIHVGPLNASVPSRQIWFIASDAQHTNTKIVTVLSADFDTLSVSEKDEIKRKTGITVIIRVIPASAIQEVRRRLEKRSGSDDAVESTTIPAFYAPLSLILEKTVSSRNVELKLARCEVDIESFIASQRPALRPITQRMSAAARKRADAEQNRWKEREKELNAWLKKAKSWQAFVDFWAIDWNYGRMKGVNKKPIFVTDWQSFRSGDNNEELTFSAKFSYSDAGRYTVAARVTDVFGNDGIATVDVEVKR